MSSDWRCDRHGIVRPLHVSAHPGLDVLALLCERAEVPVWAPYPLPTGWLLTGVAHAGDERTKARATAIACSGPAPLGGLAEMVLVAEEPGVGLGARLAGLDGPDAGDLGHSAANADVRAAGHETPLWTVATPADRCAYVGEALSYWLWAVMWPADAGYVLAEHVVLADLRELPSVGGYAFGAPSPYLRPA